MTPASGRDVARRGTLAAAHLATRTIMVRGLAVIGTLVLARLLSPADFGVYAFVWFWVVIVLAIGDGGVCAALVQGTDEPSREDIGVAWSVQIGVGLLGCLALWVLAPLSEVLLPQASATDFVRVLALSLPIVTLRALPTAMFERHLRFGPLAAAEVAGQVAFYAAAIPLAMYGAGAWSLVLGGVAHATAPTVAILAAYRSPPRPAFHSQRFRALVRFGLPYQTAVLLTWLRDASVPFIGALVGGPVIGGYLQFASRLGQFIGSGEEIVGRVAFPAFSRLQRDPVTFARTVAATSRLGMIVTMPAAAWVVATAPTMVPIVFGPAWGPASIVVQFIAVGVLVRFPARVVRQALFAYGDTAGGLRLAALASVATVVPVAALLGWAGLMGAGVGFMLGSFVSALPATSQRTVGGPSIWDLLRLMGEAAVLVMLGVAVLMALGGGAIGLIGSGLAVGVAWVLAVLPIERQDLKALTALRRRV